MQQCTLAYLLLVHLVTPKQQDVSLLWHGRHPMSDYVGSSWVPLWGQVVWYDMVWYAS
jgi:hypothetical protein